MKSELPLVSVIVPCYNHEKFIRECIESIVNQTFRNFELTVIDDGSKDNSRNILKELQLTYGFNLVLQENIGLASTLNRGITEFAKGEYFTSCSSDDYWALDKLEKQVQFMEEHKDIDMCYGKTYIVDHLGKTLSNLTEFKNKNLKGGKIFKDIILVNFHPPVNYFFRKTVFEKVGLYKKTWAEDFYMNLKISNRGNVGFIDHYLSYYRVTNDAKSKKINLKTIYSHLESIEEYRDSVYYNEAVKMWYLRCFYWYSPYRSTKVLAAKGLFRNLDKVFNPYFIKSLIKFLFIWK